MQAIQPRMIRRAVVLIFSSILILPAGAATQGYYRAPSVHGDAVIFTSEGDLWKATLQGGVATRLTAHPSAERLPHFSPDGKFIAFTADYASAGDVYIIPAEGGEPKQLTFHPAQDEVVGWTPDGKAVLFTSHRSGLYSQQWIYKVSIEGGESEQLPVGRASLASFNADATRLAFNRHDWQANWKRYQGGTAPDIWIADLQARSFARIIDNENVNSDPMWVGDRIYFLSERAGLANLFSCAPDGADVQQLTTHEDFDCRSANTDGRTIVYACGADVWAYDIAAKQARRLDITIASDRIRQQPQTEDAGKSLDSFALNKDGTRIAIDARGDVWMRNAKKDSRNAPVAVSNGSRERAVNISPDGKTIAAISDATGEQEIVLLDVAGREKPRTLTSNKKGWLFAPVWSPDSSTIAFADLTGTLYSVDVESGEQTVIDKDENAELTDYVFSPDGAWLGYSKYERNKLKSIYLYSLDDQKKITISQGFTNDYSPTWGLEGKYLYFLSDRSINPILGVFDREFICKTTTKVCCVILTKDGKSPLLPEELQDEKKKDDKDQPASQPTTAPASASASASATSASGNPVTRPAKKAATKAAVKSAEESAEESAEADTESDDELPEVTVDVEGIESRVIEFAVTPGIYDQLRAAKGRLYYLSYPLQGMAEEPHAEVPKASLATFDLAAKTEHVFTEGIAQFALSDDGTRIAYEQSGVITIADVGDAAPETSETQVHLSSIPLRVNLRDEWKQIFGEAWRLMRDFYWTEDMAGVDWPAMRVKYEPLVARVGTRGELNDLIGQMIGELGTSHTYVYGGDTSFDPPPAPVVATLGADIELDPQSKLHRFAKVLRAPAWETEIESPLTRNDVDVKDGDYLIAINGHEIAANESVDQLLLNLAGQQVQLTICSRPDKSDARDVQVKTLASDQQLRYRDWVRRNIEYVDKKSGGKIGYLHIPDMGAEGLIEFIKGFYPQIKKDALVIDIRDNGGGFVSQMMIERLNRKVWAYDRPRRGPVGTYPDYTHEGYKAVIVNEHAGSDGDIFPYSFRAQNLGPVIGKRTWGGVIGIRSDKAFVDTGMMTQPEYAWWDRTGWSIENRGVDPDIEVDFTPLDYINQKDPQLDRAIDELTKMLKEKPLQKPTPPMSPDKSGRKKK